jgi:hypothetical protein
MSFYGISVQRLAMHLGENPENPEDKRYVHQKATLQHSIEVRDAMTNGSPVVPGKRPRTSGSNVNL